MNGIYLIANDVVYDWFISAVTSIRAKGAACPIVVIPFDARIARISAYCAKFNYQIWDDPGFAALDEIAALFYPNSPQQAGMFRKFACFWGPFEKFCYLDVDMVALMNWDETLKTFDDSGDDFWFFAGSPNSVYRPGPLLTELTQSNRTFQFNAGAFASRRGLFDIAGLERLAQAGVTVKSQFCNTGDQPFFNYCIDHSDVKARSASDAIPLLRPFNWANSTFMHPQSIYTIADQEGTFRGKYFSCIHWAGIKLSPRMPYSHLFLKYRLLKATREDKLKFLWKWWFSRGAVT